MGQYSWSLASAIYQLKSGEEDSARTQSASDWLYNLIVTEVQDGHPLILGSIAEALMDALMKK